MIIIDEDGIMHDVVPTKVLEQIRAEIKAYDDKLKLCKASPSIEYVLQIIDKYR